MLPGCPWVENQRESTTVHRTELDSKTSFRVESRKNRVRDTDPGFMFTSSTIVITLTVDCK